MSLRRKCNKCHLWLNSLEDFGIAKTNIEFYNKYLHLYISFSGSNVINANKDEDIENSSIEN